MTDQGLACTLPQAQVNPELTYQQSQFSVSMASIAAYGVYRVSDSPLNLSTACMVSTVQCRICSQVAASNAGKGDLGAQRCGNL